MGGYDETKDKILKEENINNGEFKVQLCSYNNGPKKIAIVKEMYIQDKRVYTTKIGRLDKETAQKIATIILKMIE